MNESEMKSYLEKIKEVITTGDKAGQQIIRLVDDYGVREQYVGGMYNTDVILKLPLRIVKVRFNSFFLDIEFNKPLETEVLQDLCQTLSSNNPMHKAGTTLPYAYKCAISVEIIREKRNKLIVFMESSEFPRFNGNTVNIKHGVITDGRAMYGIGPADKYISLAGYTMYQKAPIYKNKCENFNWTPAPNEEVQLMISFWY